jgi:hypothetical protein
MWTSISNKDSKNVLLSSYYLESRSDVDLDTISFIENTILYVSFSLAENENKIDLEKNLE